MPDPTFIPMFKWDTYSAPDVITLTDPPVNDPFNEEEEVGKEVSVASSGKMQIQRNYTKKKFKLNLQWLTSAQKAALEDFKDEWASYGYTFRFFPSYEATSTYYTVQLINPDWKFLREQPDGAGDFTYSIT